MKNQYNNIFVEKLGNEAVALVPHFNASRFVAMAAKSLENLEMKARIKQIGEAIFDGFNRDYLQVYQYGLLLFDEAPKQAKSGWQNGIKYDPLAYVIEHYGLGYFQESMFLIGEITKRYTSEFAIRNLMFHQAAETIVVLEQWAKSENEHLRRLASEGTRTRLPWGRKLHNLIAEPHLTRGILETLKFDASKYVQKSVANHLNDISKDHEGYFYEIIESWSKEKHLSTQWIIKHALRNEIKKGHPRALNLLGYKPVKVQLNAFTVSPNQLKLGQHLQLSCNLTNLEKQPVSVVVDFGIHLVKSNGSTFFKVFKWKNCVIQAGDTVALSKKHLIQKVTTRVYHAGIHQVDVLVTGKKLGSDVFDLKL